MSKNIKFKLILAFFAGALCVLALVFCGVVNSNKNKGEDSSSAGVAYFTQNNLDYKFIKPLLDVEYANQEDSLRQFPLHAKIKSLVEKEIEKYPEVEIGFYFNDLNNAGWFGINEDKKFIPASLLKLPMLISYYKLRESDPNIFNNKIAYVGDNYNSVRNTGESSDVTPGNTYTVEQLLRNMIINSDNNALELLYNFRKDALKDIFEDLNAPLPEKRENIATQEFITPREMSKFFLVLYNGSYLKKSDSEEALKLLSEVRYKDGIVAGVPNNIVVSHKYGERQIHIGNGDVHDEFHDCGIVYYTQNPYKLCIMTKGKDLTIEKSSTIISSLSKLVYQGMVTGK